MNNAEGITREIDSNAEKGAELLADANAIRLKAIAESNIDAKTKSMGDAEIVREEAYQQLATVDYRTAEKAVNAVRARGESQRSEGLALDADRHVTAREKFLDAQISEKENRKAADFDPKAVGTNHGPTVVVNYQDPNAIENTSREQSRENQQRQSVQSTDVMRDMGEKRQRPLPDDISERYAYTGKNFYEKNGEQDSPAFTDRGTKFSTSRDDAQVAADMVRMAEARGWNSIELKGSDEFKRAAWQAAEDRGIATKGYTPTEKDIEEAANKRAQSVERVDTNDITRRGELPANLREQAKTDPEALKAAGIHQLAKEVAKQLLKDPTLQVRFEHVVERRLDEHLKGERPLPDVQIRNDRDKERGDEPRDLEVSR